MPSAKAQENLERKLKDAGVAMCGKLADWIRNTGPEWTIDGVKVVSLETIARMAGLTRRNGRVDDNEAYHMLALSGCRGAVGRKYGMKCYDSKDVLDRVARWCGSWAFVGGIDE